MHKLWRIVSAAVLVCFVIGIAGVGVGFFTGSSPVVIREHGSLAEYAQRLAINRDILLDGVRGFLANLGL